MYGFDRHGRVQRINRDALEPAESLALAPHGRSGLRVQAEQDEAEVRAGRMTTTKFYQLYGRAPRVG